MILIQVDFVTPAKGFQGYVLFFEALIYSYILVFCDNVGIEGILINKPRIALVGYQRQN